MWALLVQLQMGWVVGHQIDWQQSLEWMREQVSCHERCPWHHAGVGHHRHLGLEGSMISGAAASDLMGGPCCCSNGWAG